MEENETQPKVLEPSLSEGSINKLETLLHHGEDTEKLESSISSCVESVVEKLASSPICGDSSYLSSAGEHPIGDLKALLHESTTADGETSNSCVEHVIQSQTDDSECLDGDRHQQLTEASAEQDSEDTSDEEDDAPMQFFCRQWVFSRLQQLQQPARAGALLVGGAGCGKTAVCRQLVRPTAAGRQQTLHARLLAAHFCRPEVAESRRPATLVLSLARQLRASPHLPASYGDRLTGSAHLFTQAAASARPSQALAALLRPLRRLVPPVQRPLLLVVDSCETSELAELLANQLPLLPSWLLLIVSCRRASRHTIRALSSLRKICLDDLRRASVVTDLQQYILCRVERDAALRLRLPRRSAADALHQLHIKSAGSVLYLERVLSAVAEGSIQLAEVRDIPGTLNGLFLWLSQRLFTKKHFHKALPVLTVLLAAARPPSRAELLHCVRLKHAAVTLTDFERRLAVLRPVTVSDGAGTLRLFHHSYAEWLMDVKHCTQRFLCSQAVGHGQWAAHLLRLGAGLTPAEVCQLAEHVTLMWPPLTHEQQMALLVWSGADIGQSLQHGVPEDAALQLLLAAGAEPPPDIDSSRETSPAPTTAAQHDGGQAQRDAATDATQCDGQDWSVRSGDESPIPRDTSLPSSEAGTALRTTSDDADLQTWTQSDSGTGAMAEVAMASCISPGTGVESSSELDLLSDELKRELKPQPTPPRELDPDPHLDPDPEANYSLEDGDADLQLEFMPDEPEFEADSDPGEEELAAGASGEDPGVSDSTLLLCAARRGDVSLARRLLRRGVSPEAQDGAGQTPLAVAARLGHAQVVAALLTAGAAPDRADGEGWTPLRAAAWAGHADVVEALLCAGAAVDSADHEQRTALRAAAWAGHSDIVSQLVAAGADVNHSDRDGRTALIAAAYMGHAEIVQLLLERGAQLDHQDGDGRTALSVAALCVPARPDGAGTVQLLLDSGADVNHRDQDGLSPLLVAAFEGHREVCELLLEADADPDQADAAGRTPLFAAASMGHAGVVQLLLFWGCYCDNIDADGRTVLSVAAARGCTRTVRLLLDRGLDEAHRDNAGWTPAHYAAYEGHGEVLHLLMGAGAGADQPDTDGRPPLLLAAERGRAAAAAALLTRGADPNQRALDGRTPLRAAVLRGDSQLARRLLRAGADPSYRDLEGRSHLYLAALEGRLAEAALLLDTGADVDAPDPQGRTPLHVAAWQGHAALVRLLLTRGAAVDVGDAERRTPLISAAWQGRPAVVRALLSAGAAVDRCCSQGATPLCIAAQEGHTDCVRLLLDNFADPNHADAHGRSALRVALKGGHESVVRLLEEYGAVLPRNSGPAPVTSPATATTDPARHSPAFSPCSSFEKSQSYPSVCGGVGRDGGGQTGSGGSSGRSSGDRTASSRRSSQASQERRTPAGRRQRPAPPPPPALPLIYADPHDSRAAPPPEPGTGRQFTFTQNEHMRIILGGAGDAAVAKPAYGQPRSARQRQPAAASGRRETPL